MDNRLCLVCENTLTGKQQKYCNLKCKNKGLDHSANCYKNQKKRAVERKMYCVNKLGGSCKICGYNKNIAALAFHHLDPSKKSFNLDARKLANSYMIDIEEELTKCILVCHNCHSELHHPEYNDILS